MKARFTDMHSLIEPIGEASVTGEADGGMVITRMHFPAGVDLGEVLPDHWCSVPHWGYVVEGAVHITYDDGSEETAEAGTVYYMRPGHCPRFDVDTTMLEVSPEQEMLDIVHRVADAAAGATTG